METWWKVTLSVHDSGLGGQADLLKERFARVFMANGGPSNVAMFIEDDLKLNRIIYFSPRAFYIASNLLAPFKPVPCGAPRFENVKLAVGHLGTERISLGNSEAA